MRFERCKLPIDYRLQASRGHSCGFVLLIRLWFVIKKAASTQKTTDCLLGSEMESLKAWGDRAEAAKAPSKGSGDASKAYAGGGKGMGMGTGASRAKKGKKIK